MLSLHGNQTSKNTDREERSSGLFGSCIFLRVYPLPEPYLIRNFDLHPSRIELDSPDLKDGWVVEKSHAFRIPCVARAESMMPAEDRDTTTNKKAEQFLEGNPYPGKAGRLHNACKY